MDLTNATNVLARAPGYLYLSPHPALAPYIAHYTITFPSGQPTPPTLQLIPDASGCIVGTMRDGWDTVVWGPTTKTAQVNNDPSIPLRVFVEFLPGGAFALAGISLGQLTDLQVPLDDVQRDLGRQVSALLELSRSARELSQRLDQLFLARLARSSQTRIGAMLLDLERHDALSVHKAAQLVSYSERHLGRLLRDSIGMSLKTYARLLKINLALQGMQTYAGPMSALAQQLNYFDQSHFIHDFKSVCGVTPTQYRQRMSDFYKEPFKLSGTIETNKNGRNL